MLYNDKKTQLTRKTYPKYAPNNRATKDKTQKLIKVKEETDKFALKFKFTLKLL